jgi:hypothetical protein
VVVRGLNKSGMTGEGGEEVYEVEGWSRNRGFEVILRSPRHTFVAIY